MNLTEKIESVILSNLQPKQERKIGVECECILYNNNYERLPADSDKTLSSNDILVELQKAESNDKIKSKYTLEPGGQIEWASPPLKTIHEIDRYFKRNRERLKKIIKHEDVKILDYSLEPFYNPLDIPLISNKKYQLMDKMFSKTGELGKWMMRNTTSIQINIDYSSKEEAEKMAFVVDCITPLTAILFANSPFWQGKSAGKENLRYKIWNNTDASRCGDLLDHGMESAKNLVSKYSEYIQTVPAIFVKGMGGKVIEFKGTLGKWLKQLEVNNDLTTEAIQIALHQIFTNVRFKNVLEIRGCDKSLHGFEMAPAVFWAGLLLDNNSLDEIFNIVKDWTVSERNILKENAFNLDIGQPAPQNKIIAEWLDDIIKLSERGLENRAKAGGFASEARYLSSYHDYFINNGIPALVTQKNASSTSKKIRNFIK